jgi:hypothetical protein
LYELRPKLWLRCLRSTTPSGGSSRYALRQFQIAASIGPNAWSRILTYPLPQEEHSNKCEYNEDCYDLASEYIRRKSEVKWMRRGPLEE